jgi:hypothetical protein
MNGRIADALDGLSARELEALRGAIGKRLSTCIVCGSDGALPVRFTGSRSERKSRVSLLICPACFEKHRLPESKSESQSESDSSASHAER